METYLIRSTKTGREYRRSFGSSEDCYHWIVNHLDLSDDWRYGLSGVRVETREVPPSWNDCSGHHGWTEYRVKIDGKTILDTFGQGDFFEDEEHAITTAKILHAKALWETIDGELGDTVQALEVEIKERNRS